MATKKVDLTALILAVATLDSAFLAFDAACRAASEATTAALGTEPSDPDALAWVGWDQRFEAERTRAGVSGCYAAIARAEDAVVDATRDALAIASATDPAARRVYAQICDALISGHGRESVRATVIKAGRDLITKI